MLWRQEEPKFTEKCRLHHADSPLLDLPIRQELYAISVWPHAAFSQRATCPPSAAVRQRSIALITFNWSRLICPLLASRQGP